jgi:hypothetical protein
VLVKAVAAVAGDLDQQTVVQRIWAHCMRATRLLNIRFGTDPEAGAVVFWVLLTATSRP